MAQRLPQVGAFAWWWPTLCERASPTIPLQGLSSGFGSSLFPDNTNDTSAKETAKKSDWQWLLQL